MTTLAELIGRTSWDSERQEGYNSTRWEGGTAAEHFGYAAVHLLHLAVDVEKASAVEEADPAQLERVLDALMYEVGRFEALLEATKADAAEGAYELAP